MNGNDGGGRTGHDECYACPIGGMFERLDGVQPDAIEHLLAAAHELLQAMRAVIEAADVAVEHQRSRREPREPEPRLRRIVVE